MCQEARGRGRGRGSSLLWSDTILSGDENQDQRVESDLLNQSLTIADSRYLSVELFMSTRSWNEDVGDDDDDHDSFEADEF